MDMVTPEECEETSNVLQAKQLTKKERDRIDAQVQRLGFPVTSTKKQANEVERVGVRKP
jgi:hypothetical protein